MTDTLDKRLAAALSLVRKGSRGADIGCDHGKLSVQLIKQEVCPFVIAADLRTGPLKAAKRLICQENVAGQIDCRLGDGLSVIKAGEVDDIIIAGMGGEMIASILASAPWTKDKALRFVFVPATGHEKLRRRLYEAGFALLREIAVKENGHWYTVMQAAYTGEVNSPDAFFCTAGLLAGQKSSEATGYLNWVVSRLQKELCGKAASGRYEDLTLLQQLIQQIKEEVEQCQR